jgi:hypothetical protein
MKNQTYNFHEWIRLTIFEIRLTKFLKLRKSKIKGYKKSPISLSEIEDYIMKNQTYDF